MKPILEQAPQHPDQETRERNAIRAQAEISAYEEDRKRESEPVDLSGRLRSLLIGKRIKRIQTEHCEKTSFVTLIFSDGDSVTIGSTPDVELDSKLTFNYTRLSRTTHDLTKRELKL